MMTSMKLPEEAKYTDRANYQSTQYFPQVPDIISEVVVYLAGFELKLMCTHLHLHTHTHIYIYRYIYRHCALCLIMV